MSIIDETDPNTWILAIKEALKAKYVIMKCGGNACKSNIEDIIMTNLEIDRSFAHDITNHIEQYNLDFDITRSKSWYISEHYKTVLCRSVGFYGVFDLGPEPTI